MFNISVLLDVQANLPETSSFFVCPNGFGEHLFSNIYSAWDVELWKTGELINEIIAQKSSQLCGLLHKICGMYSMVSWEIVSSLN